MLTRGRKLMFLLLRYQWPLRMLQPILLLILMLLRHRWPLRMFLLLLLLLLLMLLLPGLYFTDSCSNASLFASISLDLFKMLHFLFCWIIMLLSHIAHIAIKYFLTHEIFHYLRLLPYFPISQSFIFYHSHLVWWTYLGLFLFTVLLIWLSSISADINAH